MKPSTAIYLQRQFSTQYFLPHVSLGFLPNTSHCLTYCIFTHLDYCLSSLPHRSSEDRHAGPVHHCTPGSKKSTDPQYAFHSNDRMNEWRLRLTHTFMSISSRSLTESMAKWSLQVLNSQDKKDEVMWPEESCQKHSGRKTDKWELSGVLAFSALLRHLQEAEATKMSRFSQQNPWKAQ